MNLTADDARAALTAPNAHDDAAAEPVCAACGSTEEVRCDTPMGVCFCAGCWRQSEPPGPYEDIGGSG